MSNRAWMPLYIGDYLGDTEHLSTVQHGAYLLLLMSYWRNDGLPEDDRQLAQIAKLSLKEFRRHKPVLQSFFYDGWKNKRAQKELIKANRLTEERKLAGQKGGLKSALHRMNLEMQAKSGQAIAQAKLNHSQSHRNITSTSSVAERKGPTNENKTLEPSASLASVFARKGWTQ